MKKKTIMIPVFLIFLYLGLSGTIQVLIQTELGSIKAEIYLEKAPITAGNFIYYMKKGLYKGATFFRSVSLKNQPDDPIKIEVIQSNIISSSQNRPPIPHESTQETGLKHLDGTLSMARAEPGTAQTSFFICINDQPELDFGGKRNPDGQGFAAFGRVIEGMDVVRKIQNQPVQGQMLVKPVQIIQITEQDLIKPQ